MWESPIYKLNQPIGTDEEGNQIYREVVINVTGSPPPFSKPGKWLEGALRTAISEAEVQKSHEILDFGAGRLRNTLHLLQQGYRVCAVEYESLFNDSAPAKAALLKAKRYKSRFSSLVYPHEFETDPRSYDLILLVNVINIMPIPAERALVLQYCHHKLRAGGHLLWYTQRGDSDYNARLVPEYHIGDGCYIGRKSKYKTFYREFTVAEIDELAGSMGFELLQTISAGWRNQARLYRRVESAPLLDMLSQESISEAHVVDDRIRAPETVKPREVTYNWRRSKGNPNPERLKRESLYLKKLRGIPFGPDAAADYQRHVKDILQLLFPRELRDLRLEEKVFGGLKRLDILASNKSRSGFFYSLKEDHQIYCPTVVIECKNYRHELKNPEFDQLGSRLGRKLGLFGILAFRKAANRKVVIERCRAFFDNEQPPKVLLPLSDDDFEQLLSFKMESKEDEIEGYLDRILLEVKAG